MAITRERVRYLARLTCLSLTEEELGEMAEGLTEVMNHMKALDGAEAREGGRGAVFMDGLRADRPIPSLEREALLACAPHHDGESHLVPRTVG